MNIEAIRDYCLAKNGVTEEFPFGPNTLVFKVAGKIFALAGLERVPLEVSLKCNPERAISLREEFFGKISSGYHLNKKHWNTLQPQLLSENLVKELIDHSYDLVVKGLSRKEKHNLEA